MTKNFLLVKNMAKTPFHLTPVNKKLLPVNMIKNLPLLSIKMAKNFPCANKNNLPPVN